MAAALFSPAVARAEGTVDTWDGTADTTWYDANPNADTFTLDSAEDLAGLAELTNQSSPVTFTGKTVLLDTDVDLSGREWIAISQDGQNFTSTSFSGVFDGQGHTVYNLNNIHSIEYRYGLFGTVHEATIRNLGLEAAVVAEAENSTRLEIGTLVSWASSSTIEGCWATGSLTTPGGYLVGGLIGQCTGGSRVIGCGSSVDVSAGGINGPSVGGLVGQWENTTDGSLISDCYFNGSVSAVSQTSATGGILGICVDSDLGPTVRNCVVLTKDITQPLYAIYIGAFPENTTLEHCFWPSDAYIQDGGDEKGPLRFAYGVINFKTGEVGFGVHDGFPTQDAADDAYGEVGRNVSDFSDPALVEELNAHASNGVTWAIGMDGHPVLASQTHLIAADYSAVDAALARVPADLSPYTAESVAAVEAARGAVDRTLAADRQAEVDAMAEAIEDAVAALEKLADYDAVDAAVAKAEALDRTLYAEDSLAALDEAVADVTRGYGETRQAEVDSMAEAIESALAALEYLPADYSAVDAALAKVPKDLSGYTDESAAALERAVAAVERELDVTEQDRVDDMARAIEAALDALKEVPAPEPEPKPEQVAGDKGDLPATGDPTVLLAPALGLVGGAVLLARRRVA